MEGNNGKRHLVGGVVPPEKKQRKSPAQLQTLEYAYTVTPKPSAEVKMELAKMTGLDFKQVQAWFGNRRSLDRNGPRVYKPRNVKNESSSGCLKDGAGHLDSSQQLLNPQPISAVAPSDMVPPRAHFLPMPEGQLPWELQGKLRQVERKLGHTLIAEGPELGVEFMPLPPDAFGASLEPEPRNRAPSHSFAGEVADRLNNEPIEKYSVEATCKDRTDLQFGVRLPETFMYSDAKQTNRADRGIGQPTSNFEIVEGANRIATVACGANTTDLNEVMQNRNSQDNNKRIGHVKDYGRFVVRPRETSKSRGGAADKSGISYFHDDFGRSEGTIVATWNEKEKIAEYDVYNNDNALPGSNESDSTYGDEYDYKEEAENLADCVQSQLEIVDSDEEDSDPI